MKKWMMYLCAGAMLMSLAACGDGGQGSASGSQAESGSGAGSAAAGDASQGSMATPGNGHNYEEGWTEEMEVVKAAVVDALDGNYFPDMPLMPDMLEMQFGITADMYVDYFAEMPMISANVDTLLIIKAKDDKVKDVEDALDAYRDQQINGALQYPMNLGIVQASRIERIGNYVCFSQLGGDVMDLLDSGDEAVIQHCQELNELVIEIISQKVTYE